MSLIKETFRKIWLAGVIAIFFFLVKQPEKSVDFHE